MQQPTGYTVANNDRTTMKVVKMRSKQKFDNYTISQLHPFLCERLINVTGGYIANK